MYKKTGKRIIDFMFSLIALVIFSPIFIILISIGIFKMKGNPFYVQERIGLDGKKFKLFKFRSMSNSKDNEGFFLPNEVRLNSYGKMLRSTSLDEIPELLNILMGDMSIVGPRPLLPEYLPFYTERELLRHSVRPGLTGLAQVNGRNDISNWEERFEYDLTYIEKCSFFFDIKVIIKTVEKVLNRSDILVGSSVVVGRLDEERSKLN